MIQCEQPPPPYNPTYIMESPPSYTPRDDFKVSDVTTSRDVTAPCDVTAVTLVSETPARAPITGLAAEVSGKRPLVHVQAAGEVRVHDLSGRPHTAGFGAGSGGLTLDPQLDCVCTAAGGHISRHTRNGAGLPGGRKHLPVDNHDSGQHDIVSMTTLGKGTRMRYAAADRARNAVLIVHPHDGSWDALSLPRNDPLDIGHVAARPRHNDTLALTGRHDNQVRLYKRGLRGWKLTKRLGCQGNGDDYLCAPEGVCYDDKGRLLVCDHGNARVVRFTKGEGATWRGETTIGPEVLGQRRPTHVTVCEEYVIVAAQSGDSYSWMVFSQHC